jgi:TolB-like protein
MGRVRAGSLVVLLGLQFCSGALAGAPVTVGLLDFTGRGGMPQKRVDVLADLLAGEISRMGDVTVISRTDIRSMLGVEQQRYLFGAVEEVRAIEIGGALGVRWMVSGSVARYGEYFVVYLRLTDVDRRGRGGADR